LLWALHSRYPQHSHSSPLQLCSLVITSLRLGITSWYSNVSHRLDYFIPSLYWRTRRGFTTLDVGHRELKPFPKCCTSPQPLANFDLLQLPSPS
jgi:hypothetical protein